jgi:hypothetical protein
MFGDEYEYWFVVPEEQLALVPSDIGADPADRYAVLEQLALHGGRITTMAPCRMVPLNRTLRMPSDAPREPGAGRRLPLQDNAPAHGHGAVEEDADH